MKNVLVAVLVALLVSAGAHYWWSGENGVTSPATEKRESAYDRIMRTGVIRCGYAIWNPILMKDAGSGKISGIYYDYLESLGKKLSLKIEWSQELNLATYLADLNAGKFDLECSGGLPDAVRGKFVEYTRPIFFTPLYVFVRSGVTIYDNNLQALNTPDKSFASLDGSLSGRLSELMFPKSRTVGLPGSSPLSDMMEQVAYGKADALITDGSFAMEYMKKRPGIVRQVLSPPLTITSYNLSVPAGETRLVSMLNTATDELLFDGTIERILQKYNLPPDVAMRVALPYAGAN